MFWITLIFLFQFLSNIAVTDTYDKCYPGADFSLSFHCYGENEYCCHADFDCCQRLGTGPILGIIAAICLGLGIVIFCICGACKKGNVHQPSVILHPNQRLQVSYIAYDESTTSNHNVYEPTSIPNHASQPPPYSSIQGDIPKPPPYGSIYAE